MKKRVPQGVYELSLVEPAKLDDTVKGFEYVQQFLQRFGYLDKDVSRGTLDLRTSTALAQFQEFNGLRPTALFDEQTRDIMMMSRCGMPDRPSTGPLASVVTCAWNRTALTYAFDSGTDDVAGDDERQAVRNAFVTWSSVAPLAFREVGTGDNPDIVIGWRQADDADFSMVGSTHAHADYPPGCGFINNTLPRPLHFDDQEHIWCIGAVANQFDVETIALHEIGHLLGLQHSISGSVMYAFRSDNFTQRNLTADDIEGIRRLYPPTGPLLVKHSGKCADITGISTEDGAKLIQWDYWGGGNQLFKIEWVEAGHYRLIAQHSGKVLDVEGISTANGASLLQWPWWGGDNQKFRLEAVGHGYYRIVAKHSNRVLDVDAFSQNSGAKVQQWDWLGGDNQQWRIGHAPITAKHSGKVLDVRDISTANGAGIIQWPYWGGGNQRMRLEYVDGGYYRIMIEHSGKCLDVEGISTANGAQIIQWDYWGGDNQKFRLEEVGDGYVRVVAKHSGKCLDVEGISTADGARIIQWDYWGGDNQKWRM